MADEENEEARRLARMAMDEAARITKKYHRNAHLSVLERVLRARRFQERTLVAANTKIQTNKVRKFGKVLEASAAERQYRRSIPWLQMILRHMDVGEVVAAGTLIERVNFFGFTSLHRTNMFFEMRHSRAFGLSKAAGEKYATWWLTAKAADWRETARRNLLWRFPDAQSARKWHRKEGLDGDELLAKWIAHAYPFVREERKASWLHLSEGHEEQDELWIPPRLRGHRLLQVPRRRSDRLID